MLGAWMKRGAWWSCLGVGRYSFAPYKVVWEAYGKSNFTPQVFSAFQGRLWQPNQAMHSFYAPSPRASSGFRPASALLGARN